MEDQYQTYFDQSTYYNIKNNYEYTNNNFEKNRTLIPKKADSDSLSIDNYKKKLAFNHNNNYTDTNSLHYQDPIFINARPTSQNIINRPRSGGGLERRLSFIQASEFLSTMDLQEIFHHRKKLLQESESFESSNFGSTSNGIPNHQLASISDGKTTLGRKALKIAQKAQKLSISSIGSELSSSASALYALFSTNDSNGIMNNHTNNNNNNASMSSWQYSNNNIQIANLNFNYNKILVKYLNIILIKYFKISLGKFKK